MNELKVPFLLLVRKLYGFSSVLSMRFNFQIVKVDSTEIRSAASPITERMAQCQIDLSHETYFGRYHLIFNWLFPNKCIKSIKSTSYLGGRVSRNVSWGSPGSETT